MTIENDRTGTITGTAVEGRSSPERDDVVETGKAEARQVAATAKEAGKDVVDEVTGMTAEVATTAKDEFQRLMSQASTEVKTIGRERGEQLATRLESLARQMRALREGRADEATDLRGWMTQAEQRMQHYASALRQRGPEGVLDDVRRFARRRPAMFLFAAGVTGFAVGRAVRAGAMSTSQSEARGQDDYSSNGRYGTYGSETDDLSAPIEYRATAVIIEPDDTLQAPSAATRRGQQNS